MAGVLSTGNFYRGENFYRFRCVCDDGETTLYSNSNYPPLCNGCPSIASPVRRRMSSWRNASGENQKDKLLGGLFQFAVVVSVVAIGSYLLISKNLK